MFEHTHSSPNSPQQAFYISTVILSSVSAGRSCAMSARYRIPITTHNVLSRLPVSFNVMLLPAFFPDEEVSALELQRHIGPSSKCRAHWEPKKTQITSTPLRRWDGKVASCAINDQQTCCSQTMYAKKALIPKRHNHHPTMKCLVRFELSAVGKSPKDAAEGDRLTESSKPAMQWAS